MNANYLHQMQLLKQKKDPPSKKNHRKNLQYKLADVMFREVKSSRTRKSVLGDDFEFVKSLARFRFKDDELRDLCICLAGVVVDSNNLCHVTEVRKPHVEPRNPTEPSMRIVGQ